MKRIHALVILLVILTLTAIIILAPRVAALVRPAEAAVATSTIATTTPAKPALTHRQDVWLYVLEWCESKGKPTAINQVDRDGTPSYYSFQFKPGTFKTYGEKYGIIKSGHTYAEIMELLKSYELQRSIVTEMIRDPKTNWEQQFPNCVRTYGRPPQP